MGTEFDAAREWLEDNNAPEEVKAAFEASPLRSKVEELTKEVATLTKERDTATNKLTRIEKAPVLKEALAQLNIDYDAQPKYAQKALDSFSWEGDKPDAEELAKFVSDEGFEVSLSQEENETPPAGQIAQHAQQASSRFVKTESIQEQIANAEAEMAKHASGVEGSDPNAWAKSFALKNRLLEQQAQ